MSGDDAATRPLDYSVVTITYNEAENIGALIEAIASVLRPTGKSFEIIVVDDESPDGTAEVVRRKSALVPEARLIERHGERGIGSAYFHGIRASRGRCVATMDADFSHHPDVLPRLFASAEEGALSLGSRFLRRGDFITLWYRVRVTRGINFWHRHFLRTGLCDHTNGFMAIRRDVLDRLIGEGESMGMPPFSRVLYVLPLVVCSMRLGISIRETAARYIFRTKGVTKIRFLRGVVLLFEEWRDSVLLKPHARRKT